MSDFGSENTPRNIIIGFVIIIGAAMILSFLARKKLEDNTE
tara:strand:+ start:1156 stop:1278 length:123 start_codon:yes stop_codon:yes gene_type:complete